MEAEQCERNKKKVAESGKKDLSEDKIKDSSEETYLCCSLKLQKRWEADVSSDGPACWSHESTA